VRVSKRRRPVSADAGSDVGLHAHGSPATPVSIVCYSRDGEARLDPMTASPGSDIATTIGPSDAVVL
jgi:hypothetical protein